MDAPSIVTCYISLLILKIKVATVCALECLDQTIPVTCKRCSLHYIFLHRSLWYSLYLSVRHWKTSDINVLYEFKWIFTGHLAGLVCGNCSESQNKCY